MNKSKSRGDSRRPNRRSSKRPNRRPNRMIVVDDRSGRIDHGGGLVIDFGSRENWGGQWLRPKGDSRKLRKQIESGITQEDTGDYPSARTNTRS